MDEHVTAPPVEDTDYRVGRIENVEAAAEGGWTIHDAEGSSLYCPAYDGTPKPEDPVRYYGKGFGYPVRGLVIAGRTVYYRTVAEQEQTEEEQRERWRHERQRTFEENRGKLDADYASLPPEFQARLDRFRRNKGDAWRPEFEPYEMSVCVDAVKIARALGSAALVEEFRGEPWERQQVMVPGLFDGHSGNSFGAAVALAHLYLTNPDLIDKYHGSLCPLVGCSAFGCYASEGPREDR